MTSRISKKNEKYVALALEDIRSSMRLNYENSDAQLLEKIFLYLKTKELIIGFEMLMDVPVSEENRMNALYMKQMAYYASAAYKTALDIQNKIMEDKKIKTSDDYYTRAIIYKKMNRLKEALYDAKRAIMIDPQYSSAYRFRGQIYQLQGKRNKAIECFTRGIRINKNTVLSYLERGSMYYTQGRKKEALRDFTKAIKNVLRKKKEYLEYYEGPRILAQIYGHRAVIYAENKKFKLALSDLKEAIQYDPAKPGFFCNRGELYLRLGENKKALEDLNKAIKMNSKLSLPYCYRGKAYRKEKKYQKALKDLNQAIKMDKKLALAHLERGIVYRKLGNTQKALNEFLRALSLEPHLYEAHYQCGLERCFQHNFRQAMIHFRCASRGIKNLKARIKAKIKSLEKSNCKKQAHSLIDLYRQMH